MSLSLPFREIWCVDFEYETASGERPAPLCMCGLEVRSGRQIKLWRDELLSLKRAPFDGDSVTVAMRPLRKHRAFFSSTGRCR
jgi:DNA polymerase-1